MNRTPGAARGRGRPPRLSRERIIAAARTLAPEDLTMRAVADALGVNRKSLNYHVSDRQGLLELVAFDAGFRRVVVPEWDDWRELLHLFAVAVVDVLVQVGALIAYMRFDGKNGLSALTVVEQIVATLVAAGLSPGEAGRTLKLIAEIAQAAAREAVDAGHGAVDRQAAAVSRTLGDSDEFPLLSSIAHAHSADPRIGRQFEFDIAVIIDGLQRRLELRGGTPPGGDQPA